jgi:hypothetical protein
MIRHRCQRPCFTQPIAPALKSPAGHNHVTYTGLLGSCATASFYGVPG